MGILPAVSNGSCMNWEVHVQFWEGPRGKFPRSTYFVCLFQYENEAQKFYQLLIERLKKFGLEIAEDKSRILPFGRYKGTKESFDFLGFTHYNAKSHWGKYCVLHRTSKKKLKMKREAIKKWLWEHMHESIKDTIEALNVRLTGHYRYYGIYGNFVGLLKFYKYVLVELRKSKRRRDQTNWLTWNKYINILKIHPLECPKIYLNSAYSVTNLLKSRMP